MSEIDDWGKQDGYAELIDIVGDADGEYLIAGQHAGEGNV
jgi:hypothetical protein